MGTAIEGKSKIITLTPVISTSIYAAADQLGSLVEIQNAMDDSSGTGAILSVTILDKAAQSSIIDVLFFSSQPTVASSDNAALDITDAMMASYYLGHVRVQATDYIALAGCSVASIKQLGLLVQSLKDPNNLGGKSLWMILRSGGTPTYGSTSDLVIRVGILQD
jgi:hypothetical protein